MYNIFRVIRQADNHEGIIVENKMHIALWKYGRMTFTASDSIVQGDFAVKKADQLPPIGPDRDLVLRILKPQVPQVFTSYDCNFNVLSFLCDTDLLRDGVRDGMEALALEIASELYAHLRWDPHTEADIEWMDA